jgi:hypothetical protein
MTLDGKKRQVDLGHAIKMDMQRLLPTALAGDDQRGRAQFAQGGTPLKGALDKLLPSPMAHNEDLHGSELSMVLRAEAGVSNTERTRRKHRLMPTPMASDSCQGPDFAKLTRSSTGIDLTTALNLQPTPQARDWKGEGYGNQLPEALAMLQATPTASLQTWADLEQSRHEAKDRKSYAETTGPRGPINPYWEEIYMGLPPGWTELPEYPTHPKTSRRKPESTD